MKVGMAMVDGGVGREREREGEGVREGGVQTELGLTMAQPVPE